MSAPSEFSFRTRARNLRELASRRFDVLVIGGGITGAGVARDAALRGLSVALVERRDFASGTSSRSSKLIHGGLRYLQQGDVALVREAATERYVLRRLAPHLARPAPMLLPIYSRGAHAKMRVGLWTYDRLASVADGERHRMLGRDEALALEPRLRPENLHSAGLYYEYLTDDARLVIEVVKAAAAAGAVAANYAEVEEFMIDAGRIDGARVRDACTDERFAVRAQVVINATGPWVDVLRLRAEAGGPRLRLTSGIHLGLCSERIGLSHIVVMPARDGRGVFAIPRGAITYLGTTDAFYAHPDDNPDIALDDALYLLAAANRAFALAEPLTPDDVVSAWAGLRPLLHQEGKQPAELSRQDEVMVADNGLISVAGGKLTTFRRMAGRVVDLAAARLPAGASAPDRGASATAPLGGGGTGDALDLYAAGLHRDWPAVPRDVIDRLVALVGSRAADLVARMAIEPALAERLHPGLAVTRAEVDMAVGEEMALTLTDVLERRARLLPWTPDMGRGAAPAVAGVMARLLGWDAERRRGEVAAYEALTARLTAFARGGERMRALHG
ncbi:MAG: FAD-dependent oxidoreductase [Candidatus Binatia bacterium]